MSNNTDMDNTGERLSFMQLFKEKNFYVEIPIIQRDYAQGRSSAKEVRNQFLNALHTYLVEGKPNRDLDFVYGSIIKSGDNYHFIPLDGQQRLTTLFLLHWYLASISGNIASFRTKLLFENKSRFTYETRTSSREFCSALIKWDIPLDKMLQSDDGRENTLSKTLQDCGWFFRSWKLDPTVQSMLTMLDAIHQKFSTSARLYESLFSEEVPVITFLYLNLKNFGLTDDLYIKMNARGKPLTAFENFKAKFEQYIGTCKWDESDERTLSYNGINKQVSVKEYFCHKIDTSWSDVFWQYRNVTTNDSVFDDEIMNFFRFIITNEYAISRDKDMTLEILLGTDIAKKNKIFEGSNDLTFHFYEAKGALSKEVVQSIIEIFDALSITNREITTHLEGTEWFDEKVAFKSILSYDLKHPERVMVFAYLQYLANNKEDHSGLEQWMRVIRNLTEATAIDSSDDVKNALKSIKSLIKDSNQILQYLRDKNKTITFFDGRAVWEERIKANLMSVEAWQSAIMEIDRNAYFAGQIGFVLEFSGVLDYLSEHENFDGMDASYLSRFIDYSNKMNNVSILLANQNPDFLWERAVLTKGDYLITASASRKNFLSTKRKMRDYSWKRLLKLPELSLKSDDPKVTIWHDRRTFVKKILDDTRFQKNDLLKSLEEICKDVPKDWRQSFISDPRLIDYCKQGFICHEENPQMIYLFKESQRNHSHASVDAYLFFINYIENRSNEFSPFTQTMLYAYSGEKTNASSVMKWVVSSFLFELHIQIIDRNRYEIKFFDRDNKAIPSEIADVLANNDAVPIDDNLKYLIVCADETSTRQKIEKLCSELFILNQSKA